MNRVGFSGSGIDCGWKYSTVPCDGAKASLEGCLVLLRKRVDR
jgi:hypothetical protein